MSGEIVTISGPPGSGKSTAGRRAADQLGYEYVSAGESFRAEAKERSMTLESFSRFAETHEEIDRRLDERMIDRAKPAHVLDGRVIGTLLRRRGVDVITVEVNAQPSVRYRRIAEREGMSEADAERKATLIEASEAARYLRLYGIDLARERADLPLESTTLTAESVAHAIVEFTHARARSHR